MLFHCFTRYDNRNYMVNEFNITRQARTVLNKTNIFASSRNFVFFVVFQQIMFCKCSPQWIFVINYQINLSELIEINSLQSHEKLKRFIISSERWFFSLRGLCTSNNFKYFVSARLKDDSTLIEYRDSIWITKLGT